MVLAALTLALTSSWRALCLSAALPAPKPRILKQPAKEQELNSVAMQPVPTQMQALRSRIPVWGWQQRKLVAEGFTQTHHEEGTRTREVWPGMAAQACRPSAHKAEVERLLQAQGQSGLHNKVTGQPGLQSEILSKKMVSKLEAKKKAQLINACQASTRTQVWISTAM